ncbi:hypothetical protein E5163_02715 [Marinicauda algicola]|uniref:Uncharacterized protein n=1 Tax=Marinicauda algicola TaxID=2029849 RepID=A0A4V3RYF1_9PROT|nr:hypothetical protein [Marinicauda algicola]TGY90059.1 hypothetical protein E5163_02715 [Marinicauda algicola]
MTAAALFPRHAIDDPVLSRRALAAGLTGLVHLVFLSIILTVPLYQLPERGTGEAGGGGRTIGVYTVSAGEAGAESDAPLNEPSLADRTADGDGEGEGAGPGTGDGPAGVEQPQIEAEPEIPPAPEAQVEPVETAQTPEAAEPLPQADTRTPLLAAPGSGNRALDPSERAARPARGAPAPTAVPADPDAPIATTQLPGGSRSAVSDVPRFADILARAAPGLDPADFRVEALAGDLDAAVRESLCLSSSQATLEAGRCPEGPNPNQAALAAYGLTEPGEVPPQFMIDMDRLAFQLAQMGADAGAIERLMLGLSEARREAIRSPALTRQMDRDRENLTDHLGVSNPFDEEG